MIGIAFVPSGTAPPIDEKCDNTTCTRLRLDDNVDADNVLDTTQTSGAPSGNLYWGNRVVWTDGNDGAASGLDGDTLDGLESAQFLRSDQGGTVLGRLEVAGGSSNPLNVYNSQAPSVGNAAGIDFSLNAVTDGKTVFAQIYGLSPGTAQGAASGALGFYTRDSGTLGERVRIDSAGNVGIGTSSPGSALHVPDGKYAQLEDSNAGAPPSADCDSDAERGRMSIDTANNRWYVCNGATRGWDWVALND